jgi:Zn finger protein HypA/HybF involved in hydrogenase expression
MPRQEEYNNINLKIDVICNVCAEDVHMLPSIIKSTTKCKRCSKRSECSLVKSPPDPHRETSQGTRETETDDRICPHCEHVIDHLSYRTTGYEYGSCNISGDDDYNSDGFENDGDTEFDCPDCGERINRPNDLLAPLTEEDEGGGENT